MAEIKLADALWSDFQTVAKRSRIKPQALAERVLREYVTSAADKDLISRSERAALRSGMTIRKAERAIKDLRKKRTP